MQGHRLLKDVGCSGRFTDCAAECRSLRLPVSHRPIEVSLRKRIPASLPSESFSWVFRAETVQRLLESQCHLWHRPALLRLCWLQPRSQELTNSHALFVTLNLSVQALPLPVGGSRSAVACSISIDRRQHFELAWRKQEVPHSLEHCLQSSA